MTTSRIAVWLSRTANEVRRWTVRPMLPCLVSALWMMFIPGLAFAQPAAAPKTADDQSRDAPGRQAPAAIYGAVKDGSGSAVAGAIVTLETASAGQRTTITDEAGSFHFSALDSGNYKITTAASGFAVWTAANVVAGAGENQPLLSAVLQVAPVSSSVHVTLSQHELAVEGRQFQAEPWLQQPFCSALETGRRSGESGRSLC